MTRLVRHHLWIAPLLMGLTFMGGGAFMLAEGKAARDDVKTAITDERITTSADSAIPGVLVTDAKTAQAQADAIKTHIMTQTGGKTYSELDKNDPLRTTYLTSVTLRTALNLAVMGFKVSDLVMGMGVFMLTIGAAHVFFLAPVLFWDRYTATEQLRTGQKAAAPAGRYAPETVKAN